MKIEKYSELILGFIILFLGIVYFLLTNALPAKEMIDGRFLPYILSGILIVLSLVQIYRGVKFLRHGGGEETEGVSDYGTFIKSLVNIVLYIGLLNILGFIISTIVFLFLEFIILTPARLKLNYLLYLFISITTALIVYYLFRHGLSLVLPRGRFNIGGMDYYGSYIICSS